jgi:hypothetical protein
MTPFKLRMMAANEGLAAYMSRTREEDPTRAAAAFIRALCHLMDCNGEDAEQIAFKAIGQFQADMERDEDEEEAA